MLSQSEDSGYVRLTKTLGGQIFIQVVLNVLVDLDFYKLTNIYQMMNHMYSVSEYIYSDPMIRKREPGIVPRETIFVVLHQFMIFQIGDMKESFLKQNRIHIISRVLKIVMNYALQRVNIQIKILSMAVRLFRMEISALMEEKRQTV